MTSSDIQDAVLRLFDAARQSPGAAYEPERFMAHLTVARTAAARSHDVGQPIA